MSGDVIEYIPTVMSWEPPTEEEFTEEWFTPLDAVDASDERLAEEADKWAIMEQLRAGQIVAVARTAQTKAFTGRVQPFVLVPVGAWRRAGQGEEYHFWKTSHLVVPGVKQGDEYGGALTGDKERYFNIRFDPASFSGRPPPQLPPEELGRPGIDWAKLTPPKAITTTTDEPPAPGSQALSATVNRGGRPSGKAGEPIATVTLRLVRLSPEELAEQTAASLALDLIEEYKRLRLVPPVLSNAEREAAGILRALRK